MKDQNRKKDELIDELKLLRALLKRSDRDKQALSALIHYSPLAIICLDKDDRVLTWNPAAEQIFGWKEEEVLGRKNPIVPEDKQGEFLSLHQDVKQGIPYFSKELRRQKKDGTAVYLNASSASLRDSHDKVTATVGIFEDISERRRRDEAIRESDERFRRAFENAAVGSSIVDTRGRFIKVNRRLCEMLGYSETELLQRTFSDITYPDDIQKGMDALAKLMRGEVENISIEKRYIRKDGHVIHGIVSPSAIHDENGKPTHCLGLWQDITEQKCAEDQRKRAEEGLREANAKLFALIQAMPDMVYFKDCHGRFMMVNRAFEKFSGADEGTLIGRTDEDLMPPDLAEYCRKSDEEVIKSRSVIHAEEAMTGRDGEKLYFDTVKAPIYDAAGNLLGLVGVSRNVTERRLKDDAISESEARFRGAFENAAVGASMIDLRGRFIRVNRKLCEILGYSEAELLSKTFSDITHPEDIHIGLDALSKQITGEADAFSFEKRYLHRDGHVVHMIVSPSVILDKDGKPAYCVGMFQDITQRKQAEEALLLFRNLLNRSNDAITVLDPATGRFLMVNDKACSDLGYERSELLTMRTLDIEVTFPNQVAWDAHVNEVKCKGYMVLEGMNRRSDGTVFPVEVNVTYMIVGATDYMVAVVRDITERKEAAEALRSSEAMLHAIIDTEPECVKLLDSEGRLIMMNRAGLAMIEVASLEQVKGQCVYPIVTPEYRESFMELTKNVFLGNPGNLLFEMVGAKGTRRWLDTHAVPFRNEKNKIIALLAVTRDVTDRKRAEENLHKTNKTLGALIRYSPLAIICLDPDLNVMIWNPAAERIFDWKADEVLGKKNPIIPEDKIEEFRRLNEGVRQGKPYLAMDLVRRKKDGSPIHLSISSAAIHDADGNILGTFGLFQDITERKLSEQALRTSEERLSKAQKMAHVGNWEENYTTGRLYWSEEVYRIYGVDPATFTPTLEAVGKAMHPDDLEPFLKAVKEALYERKHFEMDYRLVRPDGTIRTVHTIGEVSYDPAGKPLVHAGTIQDITEQKKAEERLRQSEEFIRNILDTVDEGFIVIDRNYSILIANKAYCSQAGRSYDTVIGRPCYEISHRLQRPCHEEGEECAVRRVFETGEPYAAIHRHTDSAGAVLHVETKAFPVKDSTGAVLSVIETVNNITEKHLLEEERLKTQKLEAIGTLAGGIAHDFNNLLQGVFGYISMAKLTFDQKERSLAMLAQAEQALGLSVNLTKQLLTFSKGGKPVKTKVSLPSVIENSVKFALSGSRVDYRIMTDKNLRTVEADEGQIGQVIQNIVLNADQAMPLGGTIVITAKNVQAPNPLLPRVLKEGSYVEISIQDSGIGIPAPYMEKIFDPYFTTKEKGSGLGLATSYSIIKNHGGVIDVVSRTGVGTTCFLYLPATDAAMGLPSSPAISRAVRKGRILVMDDEELIRNIAGEMLKALGHAVEFAEHGDAAIEKYRAARESGNPFDIVILDLTVRRGLGGKETNSRLLAIDPEAKVIVSSGYSDDAAMADHRAYGFAACLTKPYQLDELTSTLNALLT